MSVYYIKIIHTLQPAAKVARRRTIWFALRPFAALIVMFINTNSNNSNNSNNIYKNNNHNDYYSNGNKNNTVSESPGTMQRHRDLASPEAHACTCAHGRAHAHALIHTPILTYLLTHLITYIHTYIHTCIHTYTHT